MFSGGCIRCPKKVNCFLTNIFLMVDDLNSIKIFYGNLGILSTKYLRDQSKNV